MKLRLMKLGFTEHSGNSSKRIFAICLGSQSWNLSSFCLFCNYNLVFFFFILYFYVYECLTFDGVSFFTIYLHALELVCWFCIEAVTYLTGIQNEFIKHHYFINSHCKSAKVHFILVFAAINPRTALGTAVHLFVM